MAILRKQKITVSVYAVLPFPASIRGTSIAMIFASRRCTDRNTLWYSASLSAAMEITPDEKNPTASDSTMKSGYGVNQVVTARVNSSQRSATTALQNAVSYFPEFNYESFWRLLDRISISSSSSRLEFQKNEYSTYNRRTHFTPIWYPDGSYTVNTWVIDCWTPAGMLSVNLTDSLNIRGNLWDDWHIAPLDL